MVCEGIALRHRVSNEGLEVDKANISTIENLALLMNVKGVRIFLGHAGFYRRFIKDFSKIVRPLCNYSRKMKPLCLMTFSLMRLLRSRRGLF